jgi:hypothetical protein
MAPPCHWHGWGFLRPVPSDGRTIVIIRGRMIMHPRSRPPHPGPSWGFLPSELPGDCGMFPQLGIGQATQIYILPPGYDPVIDYHVRGAGAPNCRRIPPRPDWVVHPARPDSRGAPCRRPDERPGQRGAGPPCVCQSDAPGLPEARREDGHAAAKATRGPRRWALWLSRLTRDRGTRDSTTSPAPCDPHETCGSASPDEGRGSAIVDGERRTSD